MKDIVLYPHCGSSNHGCEAIVRGIGKVLKEVKQENIFLFTGSVSDDKKAGIEKICILKEEMQQIHKGSFVYWAAAIKYYFMRQRDAFDVVAFGELLGMAGNSVFLSIGGDNYCYGVPEYILFVNRQVRKKGTKTILFGCSVDPEAIDDRMREDLKEYDLIIARESITYEALKEINPNTKLYPDVAFQLDTQKLPLPDGFKENQMVGINLSPLIMKSEQTEGITFENYVELMEYIIKNTDQGIALIPHVCRKDNDDRTPLKKLYDLFSETGRVVLLEEHNCMEQKGFIARCRFFVGARTHATIAAYSSCVPTLVVGYSVKARGIAKDLFGEVDHYVLPVQSLRDKNDLVKGFQWLTENESKVRSHLQTIMPGYSGKALEIGEEIKKFL